MVDHSAHVNVIICLSLSIQDRLIIDLFPRQDSINWLRWIENLEIHRWGWYHHFKKFPRMFWTYWNKKDVVHSCRYHKDVENWHCGDASYQPVIWTTMCTSKNPNCHKGFSSVPNYWCYISAVILAPHLCPYKPAAHVSTCLFGPGYLDQMWSDCRAHIGNLDSSKRMSILFSQDDQRKGTHLANICNWNHPTLWISCYSISSHIVERNTDMLL